EDLLQKARDQLDRREPQGYWKSPRKLGPIFSTAMILERLSAYQQVIEGREKKDATPQPPQPLPTFSTGDRKKALKSLERGATFLLTAVDEEGRFGFAGNPDPGITAMAVGALLAVPEPRPEEVRKAIDGGLDWLVSLQLRDGSIHMGQLANYVTSASILALTAAGREGDEEVVARARRFLQALQADEAEGYGLHDRFYGGVGYGGDERPDLSNLQMALDALHAAKVPSDDPTFQKALTFLQRCQNRSESNSGVLTQGNVTIRAGDDGGAGYAPGESKAGYVELPDGTKVPRSYGSMTYALLKGFLLAGLEKDDARVEAAWKWLCANYTLDINPGFDTSSDPRAPYQGLYYYFYTMAKALDLYGDEVVVDTAGMEHPWRIDLVGRITSLQRQDGSWINANAQRWYEGNPVLATAYAMLTLGNALPAE
ncbi:MAG: terpene cyclase/mutase family protein, partial [Planctomycetota bacterium]|nr:terpene cyclase/mutase family protein [Planctomycetota bacterium]